MHWPATTLVDCRPDDESVKAMAICPGIGCWTGYEFPSALPQGQTDELRQKFRLLFRLVSSYVHPYTTRETTEAYRRWRESPEEENRAEFERVARDVEAHVPATLCELELYLKQLDLPIFVDVSIRPPQDRHLMTVFEALTYFENTQYPAVEQLKAFLLDRVPRPHYPIADVKTSVPPEARHRIFELRSTDLLHRIHHHN